MNASRWGTGIVKISLICQMFHMTNQVFYSTQVLLLLVVGIVASIVLLYNRCIGSADHCDRHVQVIAQRQV